MRAALAALVIAALVTPAVAEEPQRTSSNWVIWAGDTGPFDRDSNARAFAAITQNGHTLRLHCIDREVSLLLVDEVPERAGRFAEDMEFEIAFRADGLPIIETMGLGITRVAFEVYSPAEMAQQIMQANTLTFRISHAGTTAEWAFQTGGALAASVDPAKVCERPPAATQ